MPTTTDLRALGRALGARWSKATTTSDCQVDNLSAGWDQLGDHEEEHFLNPAEDEAYSSAERIAFLVLGDEPDRTAARDFWDAAAPEVDGPTLDDPDFLWGWIEGALDVPPAD